MVDFFVYLIKSSICLGIFLFVYCLFLRQTTFFRFNRFYLLTGLLVAFILPSFHYTYEVKVSLPIPFLETETFETAEPVETGQSSGIEPGTLLPVIYLLGMAVRLLLHFNAYRKFHRLLREGEQNRLNNYSIVDNPSVKSPFSIFNCIFINSSNLSGLEKDSILKHELTHITQRHWIDLLCGQFATTLQWFNPLMWLYIHCQKENHEFLADESVLKQGVSPVLYQAALINQKFQAKVFAFGHPFNYSKPLNRLKMMKKVKTRPWQKSLILILIPAFGAFFHVFAEPRYVVENTDMERLLGTTATDSTIVRTVVVQKNDDDIIDVFTSDNDTTLNNVLILLDGKEISRDQIRNVYPDSISSIEVLKDAAAIRMYGEKGKNSVIKITTKKPVEKSKVKVITIPKEKNKEITVRTGGGIVSETFDKNEEPLVIVDGIAIAMDTLQSFDANDIETINVYKDIAALDSTAIIKKFGKLNGKVKVIKITTKNAAKKR